MMKLKFKKLHPDAVLPSYAHAGDSGMDVRSLNDATIPSRSFAKLGTGLAAQIPDGFELQVRPRSGMAANGIVAAWGTVDGCYRGEIGVTVYNHSGMDVEISAGDRIAQLVVAPVVRAEIGETDELDSTERGAGGFGSTGK